MKFCACLTICLSLPFVLFAEDEGEAKAESAPDENAEAAETVTDPGFERFKTVLDRMPFGQPPPGFNPDAPGGAGDGRHDSPEAAAEAAAAAEASEVEQQIISSVRVSMLNRTADGRVFVGFTDSSVQPAKNYMLELGEKREKCEWQVVGADPDNREVTLSKGGVEAKLKIGGGGGAPGDKDGKAKDVGNVDKPGGRPGMFRGRAHPVPPGADAEGPGGRRLSGLEIARARHQQRREQQQAEAEQRRQADEQAKKEREQAAQEREQERREREQAAEERKAQLDQLIQIQEELRRQREEKAQREAAEAAQPQAEEPPVEE